jgi:Flp pilus assembly pilin Flp
MLRNKKGQSTAEYAILIGLIIASIVAIQPYVKRTVPGKYNVEADI